MTNNKKPALNISLKKSSVKKVEKKKAVTKEKKLDLKKIIKVDFPEHQYYPSEQEKTQIVLHHTASGRGVSGDIAWWKSNSIHVATCVLINDKGIIHQLFSSKYWAHHIGVKSEFLKAQGFTDYYNRNALLNKTSIGIEIDNWGGLIQSRSDEKWYTYTGTILSDDRVQKYENKYRGYLAFEKYTDEQIESVRQLLVFWQKRYDISLTYNDDMWDVSQRALAGDNGVWTHNSYRDDKSDCHPQPELLDMLKSLA